MQYWLLKWRYKLYVWRDSVSNVWVTSASNYVTLPSDVHKETLTVSFHFRKVGEIEGGLQQLLVRGMLMTNIILIVVTSTQGAENEQWAVGWIIMSN
jgi:hypothetical protein